MKIRLWHNVQSISWFSSSTADEDLFSNALTRTLRQDRHTLTNSYFDLRNMCHEHQFKYLTSAALILECRWYFGWFHCDHVHACIL